MYFYFKIRGLVDLSGRKQVPLGNLWGGPVLFYDSRSGVSSFPTYAEQHEERVIDGNNQNKKVDSRFVFGWGTFSKVMLIVGPKEPTRDWDGKGKTPTRVVD